MKLKLNSSLSKILFAGFFFASFIGFAYSSTTDIFEGYQQITVTQGADLFSAHADKDGKYGFILDNDLILSPADCAWWTTNSSLLLGHGFIFTGDGVDLTVKDYSGALPMIYLSGGATVAEQAALLITGLNDVTFKNIQVEKSSSSKDYLKMGGAIIAKDLTQQEKLRVNARINDNHGTVSFVSNSLSVLVTGDAYGSDASGGVIYLDELSFLSISNNGADVLFHHNYAKATTNSTVTTTSTGGASASGGVISLLYGAEVDLSGNLGKVEFKGNFVSAMGNVNEVPPSKISSATGGAISGYSSPTITINSNQGGVLFEGNYAEVVGLSKPNVSQPRFNTYAWGGALYSSTGKITLNNNKGTVAFLSNYVSSNNATGARGGAIYMGDSGSLTITGNDNVIFRNNYEKNMNADGSYSYRLRSIYSEGSGAATLVLGAPEGGSITIYDSVYVGNQDADDFSMGRMRLNKDSLGDVIFSGLKTKEDLAALDGPKIWSDAEINENRTSEIKGGTSVEGGRLIICDEAILKTEMLDTKADSSSIVMLKQGTLFVSDSAFFDAGTGLMISGRGNKLVCNDIFMEENSILSFQLDRNQLTSSSLMIEGNVESSILTVNIMASAGVKLETGLYQLLTITGDWSGWDIENISLTGLSDNKEYIYWGGENNKILFFNYIAPLEPETPDVEAIPEGLGSIDSNSLWTTTRSLWSFVGTMRQQRGYVVDPELKTAFWMTAVGDYFNQEAGAIAPGYNFSSTGYAVGVDYALVKSWNIGVGLSQTFGKQDISNFLGKIDQDALMAALKVEKSFILNNSNSIDLSFVGAYGETSNSSDVVPPLLQGDVLHSNWDDKAWLIDLQSRFTHKLYDKTLLDVYVGLQYTDAQQSRHLNASERFMYNISHGSLSSLRLPVGVGLRHFSVWMGRELASYVRLGIIQDLQRNNPTVDVESSSSSWVASGSQPRKTSYTGSVGTQVKVSAAWGVGVDYSIEAESESVNQTGRVSVMYQF